MKYYGPFTIELVFLERDAVFECESYIEALAVVDTAAEDDNFVEGSIFDAADKCLYHKM